MFDPPITNTHEKLLGDGCDMESTPQSKEPTHKEEEDPFVNIQKDESVNDSNSTLGNIIGWINYQD